MRVVDLAAGFESIDAHWSPRIAGRVNDQEIKIVTIQGEFVWHHHQETDECFLVLDGEMRMGIREGNEERELPVRPMQLIVVPRGVEHRPRSEGVCRVLLLERADTVNTGSAGGERTVNAVPLAPPQ